VQVAKGVVMLVAVLIAGVAIGVWTALMTYASSCSGDIRRTALDLAGCNIFLEHRFAAWQSVLFGVGASAVLLAAELALSSRLRNVSRGLIRWLNQDLTSGSHAG
jgi:hypothetical protein